MLIVIINVKIKYNLIHNKFMLNKINYKKKMKNKINQIKLNKTVNKKLINKIFF